EPGNRVLRADRLARPSDIRQFRPSLEQVLHGRALLGYPALHGQLPYADNPGHHPLDAARSARRLFDLAVALPRRSVRVRYRYAWHLPARTDEADPLGGGAARSVTNEHDCRPGADPHRPGPEFHDAVLPQLLCRHSAGPVE